MKFTRRLALVAAAFAACPAFADDPPPAPAGEKAPAPAPAPGPAKDGAPKAAEPAKKERKVDPKAQEAMDRYIKMLATPASAGLKEASCKCTIEVAQLGGTVAINSHWTPKDGFKAEYTLPESFMANVPEEQQGMIKKMVSGQFDSMLQPFFGGFGRDLEKCSLAYKESGGKQTIVMTPIAEDSEIESGRIVIGTDGLVEMLATTPRVDPNDPMAAMMAGVEIEVTVKHAKKGEKFVIQSFSVLHPMGTAEIAAEYYPLETAVPLVKSLTVTSAQAPEPMVLAVSDWMVDGKAVEGTEKKKAAEVKKADPAPAPKDTQPAPPVPPTEK